MIGNNWYSVRISEESFGFFKSTRGVRQGDPLSPLLFILAQEVLTYNNNRAIVSQQIIPYSHGRSGPMISHLLYADDMVIFCNGQKKSILALRDVLRKYEGASGQLINLHKSGFYVAASCSRRKIGLLAGWSGCSHKSFPMRYLGISLFAGRVTSRYFEDIETKIVNRIHGED